MSTSEFLSEGVANLLIAFTVQAYDDYVNGGILLNRSEFEIRDGVVKLLSVNNRKPRANEENIIKYYTWSLTYFKDTKYGEWLIRKGDEEIKAGHHRGINRSKILQDREVKEAVKEVTKRKGDRADDDKDIYAKYPARLFGDF